MSQSNPPPLPDKQPPNSPKAFIEYSRLLREWTSQMWLQAVKESQERRALLVHTPLQEVAIAVPTTSTDDAAVLHTTLMQ